jgi:ArsR family transcriptional regulator
MVATAVEPAAPPAGPTAAPVELARALADPLRWRIVELLSTEQLCVAHLCEELSAAQPLVSHHLKVLRETGLVEPDRYRYWTYYRLRPAAMVRLAATLGLFARSSPSGTACRRLIPGADPAPSTPARPPARQGGPAMSDRHLDRTSRATFAHSIEALHEEFRGIFSLETIERFVDESIDRLAGARVVDFIPLFVHRFSRERLRALAQAKEPSSTTFPRSCSSVSTTPAAARWRPPCWTTTPRARSMCARLAAPPPSRSIPRWSPP